MTTRRAIRHVGLGVATFLALTAFGPPSRHPPAVRHTELIKSEPKGNDTLAASPKTVKLWFTEKVELKVTRVKLLDAGGAAIALGKPARDDKPDLDAEDIPVVVTVSTSLAPGPYRINWSTAANDGHPAKGTFGFVVRSSR